MMMEWVMMEGGSDGFCGTTVISYRGRGHNEPSRDQPLQGYETDMHASRGGACLFAPEPVNGHTATTPPYIRLYGRTSSP